MNIQWFPGIRKALIGFVLVPLFLLSACRSTHHELELQPQEDKLQRQLKTWVDSNKEGEFGSLNKETIGRIATEYQAAVPEKLNVELKFSAGFGPNMPKDVGGVGWYNYWPSSMGALYSYAEQFGGNENLSIGLDRGMLAIDRLVLVLTLWVEAEFEDARDIEQMTTALNNEIRSDFRNIFLLMWLEDASPKGVFDDEELFLRIAQYLSNQGYFYPTDIPQLYRALLESDDDDDDAMLVALVTRGLATRMGIPRDDPLPPSLDALAHNWESYAESFEKFLESSDETQTLARKWATEDAGNIGLDEEGNLELESLIDAFLAIDLFSTEPWSHLHVTMHLPAKPLETNGDWDDEAGVVTWSDHIADGKDAIELPASFFAFWVVPAAEFQEQHFGMVVIDGDDLVEYALWSNGLSSKQLTEWEALLEDLDDASDTIDELRNFRFSDHPDHSTAVYAGVHDLLMQLGYIPEKTDEAQVE